MPGLLRLTYNCEDGDHRTPSRVLMPLAPGEEMGRRCICCYANY
jgi:hypothetical protein